MLSSIWTTTHLSARAADLRASVDRPSIHSVGADESVIAPAKTRVWCAGALTAAASPGGGEIQMRRTLDALCRQGTVAAPWRPWEDAWRHGDILHLFGSAPEMLPVARTAKRAGLHVVISPIAWFSADALWHEPWPWSQRAWAVAKYGVRALCPDLPSWRRALYAEADLLLPNSRAEADQLQNFFRVPSEKIQIIPNGADERFAQAEGSLFRTVAGVSEFALFVGRIEPRKNLLGLLQALRSTNLPLVIVGEAPPEHAEYESVCRKEAGPGVRFWGRIEHDDPLLASAYAACNCLILPSWFETPGLVALEAALTGAPLVLSDRGCGREYFGPHANYVNAADAGALRMTVLRAFHCRREPALADLVLQNFTWEHVARATRSAYATLV